LDPGKEGLVGQLAALRAIRKNEMLLKKPVDDLYNIVVDESAKLTQD
jgi:hypothetical protein